MWENEKQADKHLCFCFFFLAVNCSVSDSFECSTDRKKAQVFGRHRPGFPTLDGCELPRVAEKVLAPRFGANRENPRMSSAGSAPKLPISLGRVSESTGPRLPTVWVSKDRQLLLWWDGLRGSSRPCALKSSAPRALY